MAMKSLWSKWSDYTSSSNNVSKPMVHLSADHEHTWDAHSYDEVLLTMGCRSDVIFIRDSYFSKLIAKWKLNLSVKENLFNSNIPLN
jgi:hypothetical protein